jgi:hypothetical protein
LRNVFGSARRRYLVKVLHLLDDAAAGKAGAAAAAAAEAPAAAGSGSYEGLTLKALEASVADRTAAASDASDEEGSTVRLPLAAAYLVVAHMWMIKQQAAAAGRGSSSAVAAALGLDDDSDGEDSEGGDDDGWGNWEPEDVEPQQQQQPGRSKGQDVSRMVRLCFQWVVHRELAELADAM